MIEIKSISFIGIIRYKIIINIRIIVDRNGSIAIINTNITFNYGRSKFRVRLSIVIKRYFRKKCENTEKVTKIYKLIAELKQNIKQNHRKAENNKVIKHKANQLKIRLNLVLEIAINQIRIKIFKYK